MGTRRDREIERLLDKAQFEQSCLGATNRIMREELDRRIGEQLVRPRPRLYARKTYWEKLGKSERERHIIRGLAALHPDWVFCQASAALMLGLPVSLRRLKKAHVIMPGTHSKAGIVLKCQSKVPRATAAAGIVQVTSLEDTIVDCRWRSTSRTALPSRTQLLPASATTTSGSRGWYANGGAGARDCARHSRPSAGPIPAARAEVSQSHAPS